MTPAPSYRPLTRKRHDLAGFHQVWAAADHLLVVRSSRFEERYRRFLFQDIQALVITARPIQWWRVSFGLAVATACLWGAVDFTNLAARILLALLAVPFAYFAIREPLLRTRCDCHLLTQVSTERLASVARLRAAREFLATLQPLIESAQGRLALTGLPSQPTFVRRNIQESKPVGHLPWAWILLLGATAGIMGLAFFTNKPEALAVLVTSIIGEIVLASLLLVRRAGLPKAFAGLTLAGLILSLGDAGIGFAYFFYYISLASARPASLPPLEQYPYFLLATRYLVIWRLVLAASATAVWLNRNRHPGGPPSPA
jgi:hypothetical protein